MKLHARHSAKRGFTIVELAVVIVVIGILATITVFGYGAWQRDLAEDTLKSDLTQAASHLENERNWSNGYPALGSTGSGLPVSENTRYQYTATPSSFCLTATSSRNGTSAFYISSAQKTPQSGTCAGHSG